MDGVCESSCQWFSKLECAHFVHRQRSFCGLHLTCHSTLAGLVYGCPSSRGCSGSSRNTSYGRIDGIGVSFGLSPCISGMPNRPIRCLDQISWHIREEDSYHMYMGIRWRCSLATNMRTFERYQEFVDIHTSVTSLMKSIFSLLMTTERAEIDS